LVGEIIPPAARLDLKKRAVFRRNRLQWPAARRACRLCAGRDTCLPRDVQEIVTSCTWLRFSFPELKTVHRQAPPGMAGACAGKSRQFAPAISARSLRQY